MPKRARVRSSYLQYIPVKTRYELDDKAKFERSLSSHRKILTKRDLNHFEMLRSSYAVATKYNLISPSNAARMRERISQIIRMYINDCIEVAIKRRQEYEERRVLKALQKEKESQS